MFDTNTVSALVHQRAGFERAAGRIDKLALVDRLISTITLSELQTMIAKAGDPRTKAVKVWLVLTQSPSGSLSPSGRLFTAGMERRSSAALASLYE